MHVQIRKPKNPIPRNYFPHNRVEQKRDGVWVRCGVVMPVGAGDSYMGAFLFSLRKNGFLRPVRGSSRLQYCSDTLSHLYGTGGAGCNV